MTEEAPRKFVDFPFRDSIRRDLHDAGFVQPTPIQEACIEPVMAGKDVIGLAQTGTGKTAAFALPIIQKLAGSLDMGALVLAPTRELAQQIAGAFNMLGRSSDVRVAVVVGGIPITQDYKALRQWPNVLVATPGRLIDHIRNRSVVLKTIQVLVIDEADRMHDMGFIPQIREILAALPTERQTLLFTATMPADVERIARVNMRTPERISVGRESGTAERARQQVFRVSESGKTDLLIELLRKTEGRVLVFVRTKSGADRLARAVYRKFRNVARIHGNRSQADRDAAMAGFRDGRYRILIATDIAARGIDVADIEHVVNYDFPYVPEDYVHRIGRTARIGAEGDATSFVTGRDLRILQAVERLTKSKIPVTTVGEPEAEPARPHGRPHAGAKPGAGGKKRGGSRSRRGGRGRSRKPGGSDSSHKPHGHSPHPKA